MVRQLAQRFVQRLGQHAARHAHARRAPGAVLALERLAIQVHYQPGQVLQVLAQLAGVARNVGHLGHLHQRADAQGAAGEPVDPGEAAQVRAAGELLQRRGGQVVRLVEHQQAVVQLGQYARTQGRQQQVVVGHNHLRAHQRFALVVVDALAEGRAVPPGARAALGRHGAPGLGLGRGVQAVAVAVPGALGQGLRHAGVELHARFCFLVRAPGARGSGFFGEQVVIVLGVRLAGACQALELELAHIAPTPLGQHEPEGLLHLRGKPGQVLVHQLLLQCHGGGGDQHARAARQRNGNGRCAIGQRLAHARARLDDGNGALWLALFLVRFAQLRLAEGARHLLGHAALPRAATEPLGGLHHRIKRLQARLGPFCG